MFNNALPELAVVIAGCAAWFTWTHVDDEQRERLKKQFKSGLSDLCYRLIHVVVERLAQTLTRFFEAPEEVSR